MNCKKTNKKENILKRVVSMVLVLMMMVTLVYSNPLEARAASDTIYYDFVKITSVSGFSNGTEYMFLYNADYSRSQSVVTLPSGSARLKYFSSESATGQPFTYCKQSDGQGWVTVSQKGSGFDNCPAGRIVYKTYGGKTAWFYGCNRGGVVNIGPFYAYSYKTATFTEENISAHMAEGFKFPTTETTVNKAQVIPAIEIGGQRYDVPEYTLVDSTLGGNDHQVTVKVGNVTKNVIVHGHQMSYVAGTETETVGDDNTVYAYCIDNHAPQDCTYQGMDKAVKLTVSANNASYTGSSYASSNVTITDEISTVIDVNKSITYVGRDGTEYLKSATAPTNAGKYTVCVNIGGKEAIADFEITKVDSSVSADPTAKTVTYTGSAQGLVNAGTANGGTMEYSLDKTTWSTDIPTATDAGTYEVYYRVKGDVNHNDVAESDEKKVTVGINKANVQVNAPVTAAPTYNGTEQALVSVATTNDGTVEYRLGETGEWSTNIPTAKDAGEYKVYYRVAADANHIDYTAPNPVTVVIAKKEIGIQWDNGEETIAYEYDGDNHCPVATATGVEEGDTCIVTVTGNGKDYSDKAYTAEATEISSANYKLPEVVTKNFTITKRPVEIEPKHGQTKIYGTDDPALEYESSNVVAGETLAGELTRAEGEDAGVYAYTVNDLADKNPNYSFTVKKQENYDANNKFTIVKRSMDTATIELEKDELVITGEKLAPSVASVTVGGRTLSKDDYEVIVEPQSESGVYTLTIKGKGNYTGTSTTTWKLVDANAPTVVVKLGDKEWEELPETVESLYYNSYQKVTVSAADEEDELDTVSYYLATQELNAADLAKLSDDSWTKMKNDGTITLNSGRKSIVYVKATDKSGNVTYVGTDMIVVDNVAPTISGIISDKVYDTDEITFTVSDSLGNYIVLIDGEEATPTDGKYVIAKDDKEHTVEAVDEAGNKRTISNISFYQKDEETKHEHVWDEGVITKAPSCETAGEKTYTCIGDEDHKGCGAIKTEIVNSLGGHSYKSAPDFKWTLKEDGVSYEAVAYFKCDQDATHVLAVPATVSTDREKTEKDGKPAYKYTANVTYNGKTYPTTMYAIIETVNENPENLLEDEDLEIETTNPAQKMTLDTAVSVGQNAPKTSIKGLTTSLAKDNFITENNKALLTTDPLIKNVDFVVYLEVQDANRSVKGTVEETKVEQLISEQVEGTNKGAYYVDLSVFKETTITRANGNNEDVKNIEIEQIHDTKESIEVKMDVPATLVSDEADGYVRRYFVVRVHDGITEKLPTKVDKTKDADGKVTAVELTFESALYSTYAIVYADVIPATGVQVSTGNVNFNRPGQSAQLSATVAPSNATNQKITWKSDDPSVAVVDDNGVVTAVGYGVTWIRAYADDDTVVGSVYVRVADDTETTVDTVAKVVNSIITPPEDTAAAIKKAPKTSDKESFFALMFKVLLGEN